MNRRLRVAVIGCGAVSKNHGKALTDNRYADLVYAVDKDMDRAVEFCKKYGGIPLDDYRMLFDKGIDVAHVVTPHDTHCRIAVDLMEHGIDVFCEKPLAITVGDAQYMIQKSRDTGRRLGVCFQNRLNLASVEAKRIMDEGVYGRLVSAMAFVAWDRHGTYYSESPWRGTYEHEGGGCIINQSIHTLDLLDYLSGGVESLAAVDARLRDTDDYEVDDSAMILFRLKCGADAVGFCTNCYPGSKACTVELRLEKAVLTVKQSGLTIEEMNGNVIHHKAETLSGEKSEWGVSHTALINEFYRSIIEKSPFVCDCTTGLAAIRIVNAIQHSKGKFIKLGE